MAQVLATTELLESWLRERSARGQDLFDYYKEGVYIVAPAPGGEHQRTQFSLSLIIGPVAIAKGLIPTGPLNIGRDREDYRIPDLVVQAPGTPMTSPAFYATALLVVEVLSPGERAGDKLDFYAQWGVASTWRSTRPPTASACCAEANSSHRGGSRWTTPTCSTWPCSTSLPRLPGLERRAGIAPGVPPKRGERPGRASNAVRVSRHDVIAKNGPSSTELARPLGGRAQRSGGSGIRTHGGLHLTRFPSVPIRPLSHPSREPRHGSGTKIRRTR